ncbi:MAG: 23S rRNA (uracil(1939)-C(5))-methyltransferase RlmD [Pseudomonadota bacterium]
MKPYNVETTIEKLSQEGRGMAHVQGFPTFITGALPGETVEARIIERHRGIQEGLCTAVKTASAERVTPACPHFGVCGGCSLQHWDHARQVAHKEAALFSLCQHVVGVEPERRLPALVGAPWGYRHRARMGLRWHRNQARMFMGFREAHGNKVTNSTTCSILHPALVEPLFALSPVLSTLSNRESIPQIEMAYGGQDTPALVLRHLEPFTTEDLLKLQEFSRTHAVRLYGQSKGYESVVALDPTLPFDLSYQVLGLTLNFHPLDFTQIHLALNEKMVAQALDLLAIAPADRVVDLFCGVGNFTLPLAQKAAEVLGVEGDAAMTKRVMQNAALNSLTNVRAVAANLFQPLPTDRWVKGPYDKVLLDPPRSGAFEVLPTIVQWRPKNIVYVSCNPTTLVRDLAFLVKNHGYRLKALGLMDMFPHTGHSEAMALLEANG